MNMKQINKKDWDSCFFSMNVGEIFVEAEIQLSNIIDFDLVIVKQIEDFQIEIEGYFKSFQENKVTFIKKIVKKNQIIRSIQDTDDIPLSLEDLNQLAYESGKFSRFKLDLKFNNLDFYRLYDEWIINSLNKKIASKVFFIQEENEVLGFVTISITDNIAKIGLIAVSKNYQGKGLGKELLNFTENFCIENQVDYLEIPTQLENIPACNFYKKQGYQINEILIIKHLWKKK